MKLVEKLQITIAIILLVALIGIAGIAVISMFASGLVIGLTFLSLSALVIGSVAINY